MRGARGTSFVDTKDMDWLKAAGNYVELHVGPACHLVEVTVAEIEKRLDPARFVRIHRSVIVNTERIRTVQPASHSEYLVTLASGTQLRSGRTYRETMQRLISPVEFNEPNNSQNSQNSQTNRVGSFRAGHRAE